MAQHTVHMLRDQLHAQMVLQMVLYSTHIKRSSPCPNSLTHSTHTKRSPPCPNGSTHSTHAKRSAPCTNQMALLDLEIMRSVAIAMNSPVTEAVRTVHWTLLSSPATLSSAMLSFDFRAWLLCRSLRKFQGRPHLPLLYRDRAHAQYTWTLQSFACCVLLPRIGYKFLDAGTSIRLLNCSYFSVICAQRYNQAWPHAPSYIYPARACAQGVKQSVLSVVCR